MNAKLDRDINEMIVRCNEINTSNSIALASKLLIEFYLSYLSAEAL